MSATRRDFLKAAGVGVAGAALVPTARSYANIAGANDCVRVGLVGGATAFGSAQR